MSADRCPLAWKAAALEDGRLEGEDRASFDLHASRCADCRAERKALAALYAQVREPPSRALLPLERARERAPLLARANDRFVGRPPMAARTRWALAGMGVVALAAVGVFLSVRRPTTLTTSAEPAEVSMSPHYEVVEAPHAIWRTRSVGGTGRVELADGAARFAVERLGPNQHFLVALPDGELEVTATSFVVDVALGRTKSVSVMEGSVIFHRRGASELVLHAGEGWSRTDAVTAARGEAEALAADAGPRPEASSLSKAATAATATMNASGVGALPPSAVKGGSSAAFVTEPSATGATKERVTASGSSASAPSSEGRSSASRVAGERFDEGISSFVHGSYALADTQLAEFARRFPDDARCEDAAFLGAVARWRLGDVQGARARAKAYLSAYPQGLRRGEAQHIVDDAP